MCTKIGVASLCCSLFLPCRQALLPKAADRLPFALTKSQKRPHARTQRSSSRTSTFSISHLFRSVFLQDKLKDRRSFLLAARFLRPRCTSLPLARSSIIALPRCTSAAFRSAVHVAAGRICTIMIAVDRATAGPGSKARNRARTAHARQSWRFFFFFLDPRIHGSSKIRTDPRRIRIDPGFGGFVLPLIPDSKEISKKKISSVLPIRNTSHHNG